MEGSVSNEKKLTGTLSSGGTLVGGAVAVYGKDGESAYEVAVKNGFEGTEEEWLASLQGADGKDGEDGYTPIKGVDYFDGVDGKDGTMSFEDLTPEQKESLRGDPGQDGNDGVSATHSWNGTTLTITSASGTSSANLKGDKGDTGEKGETGSSGVYVGSGDMPSDCNVQIDPNGEALTLEDYLDKVYIGYANVYSYTTGKWKDAVDVTDTITFKPCLTASWDECYKPMALEASELGSGHGDGYIFHNHYTQWDYHSLSFDMYFHSYTGNGEMKIIRLHYQYADENSTPQSITAHIVTDTYLGNIDAALDSIIAMQNTLIGGDTV